MNKLTMVMLLLLCGPRLAVGDPPEELPLPPPEPAAAPAAPANLRIAPPARRPASPAPRLEALLEETRRERLRLHADVLRAKQQPAEPPRAVEAVRRDLRLTEAEHAGQMRTLDDKLRELDSVLSEARMEAESQSAAAQAAAQTPPQHTIAQAPTPTETSPEVEPAATDSAADSSSPPPRLILATAADRIRLADSLFVQAKDQEALEIYQAALTSGEPDDDRLWVEFQIANCQRRLGDIPQAEKFYRIVAGADTEFLPDCARWQLDNLQKQRDAQATLDKLKTTVASVRENLK